MSLASPTEQRHERNCHCAPYESFDVPRPLSLSLTIITHAPRSCACALRLEKLRAASSAQLLRSLFHPSTHASMLEHLLRGVREAAAVATSALALLESIADAAATALALSTRARLRAFVAAVPRLAAVVARVATSLASSLALAALAFAALATVLAKACLLGSRAIGAASLLVVEALGLEKLLLADGKDEISAAITALKSLILRLRRGHVLVYLEACLCV